ncbi:MAG: MFS transporter [Bacteroidota bacterium]
MRYKAFLYAAIVALGGFVFGLDAAVISGTVRFITSEFDLSDLQVGAVVSAPGFGVIFALLLTGILADKWGRKKTLQLIALLYLLSALWSALAPDFINLVAARFLGGLAFTSLTLAAMYIGEIAPSHMRGKLVAMNQINTVVGLSAAYFVNYLILKASNSGAAWVTNLGIEQYTWRWMLGSEIIPAAIWFVLLFIIPRSPRWLIFNGKMEEAKQVMATIMPASDIPKEVKNIQENIALAGSDHSIKAQLKKLFSAGMRSTFWLGLAFAIVQPITGINAILFYAPTVFEQLGIGTDAAFMQAVFVGVVSLVFASLALLLIDRIGRRPMTLFGLLWAVVSLGLCAYGFRCATYTITPESITALHEVVDTDHLAGLVGIEYTSDVGFKKALGEALGEHAVRDHGSILLQSSAEMPVTLILIGILSFIAAFQFSVGPIMWIVFSEIFSTQVRAVAIPAFALVVSIVSYFVQQFFPWQLTNMGASDIFLFYAITSAIGFIALFRLLPETKNKSIEEIEEILKVKSIQSEFPKAETVLQE